MKKSQAVIRFFKYPNIVVTLFSYAAGFTLLGGLIAAALLDVWNTVLRIFMAIFSSTLIVYGLYGTAVFFRLTDRLLAAIRKNKTLSLFIDSYNYRTVLYACGSIIIETAFGLIGLISGLVTNSSWYITNGTYYLLLAVLRLYVVLGARKPKKDMTEKEIAKKHIDIYTVTGVSLLLLNGVMSALFDAMAVAEAEHVKSNLMIYATAIFAFYKMTFAIVGFIKSRKNDNLITRSLRSISTVAAAVSLLAFMTSLVASFPDT